MYIYRREQFSQRGNSTGQAIFVYRARILRFITGAVVAICICISAARPQSPHRIEVTAQRYSFEPAEITIRKGETVDLTLTSVDVPHGVRIRELHLDLRAVKGKTAEVRLTPETIGTFIGHCSVFCGSGHGKMTLTIHVVG